jgi:hypothetical protein
MMAAWLRVAARRLGGVPIVGRLIVGAAGVVTEVEQEEIAGDIRAKLPWSGPGCRVCGGRYSCNDCGFRA